MRNENLSIKIVCCTQESEENFFKTKLGFSLERFGFLPFLSKQIFFNNTNGLSEMYNRAIESTQNEPTILVFIHDDVEITDHYWFQSVKVGLEHFAMIGLAGNVRHLPGATSWCCLDKNRNLDERKYWSGLVAGGDGEKINTWHSCSPAPVACMSLDGLFLAARSDVFKQHNIKFDEQFKFHHYDTDICRQFTSKNLPIGTWPISVVHHSVPNMGDEWLQSTDLYLSKWEEETKRQNDFETILLEKSKSCLDRDEHFPILRKLASECSSVTELGVRAGCSVWALAAGLKDSTAEKKQLTYLDIQPCQNPQLETVCGYHGIQVTWIQGNSLTASLNLCDLLMIDTLHTYKQLSTELRKHHSQINKYIVMHDTEAPWGFKNEVNDHSEKEGLKPAIDDFLKEFGHQWEQFAHYTNCNGLTVLKRKID